MGSELLVLLLHHQYEPAPGEPQQHRCVHIVTDTRVDHIRHVSVVSPFFLFCKFGKVHAAVVKPFRNLGFKFSTAVSDTQKHIIVSGEEKSDTLF